MTYISAKRRQKSATVRVKGPDGKEQDKFPVDSKQTAKSAVHLLGHAKPELTSSQRAAVLRKAAKYGVKPKSDAPRSKKGAAR